MSGIRPFREDDIPGVVALRAKCFKYSVQASSQALSDYFRSIFFRHPWPHEELHSLVCEAKNGSIVGFLGVLPRPLRYQEERLWLAVSTQFMVDPDGSGIIAVKLLKTFLRGPQDISMADLVNDASRKVWGSLGSLTAHVYSLYWTRPLRPLSFRASLSDHRRFWSAARPLCGMLDQAVARLPNNSYRLDESRLTGSREPIDLTGLIECLSEVSRYYKLWPEYAEGSLGWLFDRLEENATTKAVVRARVRDGSHGLAGCYTYVLTRDDVAQVVQLFGLPESMDSVLDHLCRDACCRGALAVTGRFQPENQRIVASHPVKLSRGGPWMLIDAARPELREHILSGNALLSRLEGEWWMNF